MALEINLDIVAKLLSPLVAAIGLYIANTKRPSLISFRVHAVGIPYEKGAVHTHTIFVRNRGRGAAKNVRLSHEVLPHFSVWPPRPFTREKYEGGEDIVFPVLVPGDAVSISYLYGGDLTFHRVNRSIRSDEGVGKVVNVVPQQVFPRPVIWLAQALMWIGASVVIYPVVLWLIHFVST